MMFYKKVYSLQFIPLEILSKLLRKKVFLTGFTLLFFLFTTHYFLFTVCLALEQNKEEGQILDFNMAGYSEEGAKSWEIKGKSADIFSEEVKLKDLEVNFYEKEKINLKSKEGIFFRKKNLIHLEKDVRLTTEKGVSLETNSLDYDEEKKILSSENPVIIQKENILIRGNSLEAKPDLKIAQLKEDIYLEIAESNPEKKKIEITCDGPLEIDYDKRIAYFFNNVKIEDIEGNITSDKMEVYFGVSESKDLNSWKIDKIKAIGNVKIVRGQNTSYSQEAVYDANEKKVTLTGEPKLIIYSEEKIFLP